MLPLILMLLGFTGAFVAGLLGIGGAIVLIPLLLFVPPLCGLEPISMSQASGMSIVQVLVASAIGFWSHRQAGHLASRLAWPMALATGAGALVGGLASGAVGDRALQGLYAGLAAVAVVLLLVPLPAEEEAAPAPVSVPLAAAIAGAVGVVAGMVGAGGAFLLTPLMRVWMRLPLRTVIGTSLATVLATGLMATVGKGLAQQIPWGPTAWLALGAVAGAPLGARTSHRLPVKTLRWLLAGAIAATALRLAWGLVAP